MSKIFEEVLLKNLDFIGKEVLTSETLKDLCSKLGYSDNGRYTKALSLFLTKNNIDYSHFRTSKAWPKDIQDVVCPVCGNTFHRNMNNSKDSKKVTCSHNCGNKYFAWKQGGKNYKEGVQSYSEKLTRYLEKVALLKECIVCKYTDILECHHIDEDRLNIEINNLVFLCPNHHALWHKYKSDEISDKIVEHLDYRDTL